MASWQASYRGILSDVYLASLAPEQRVPLWARILTSGTSPITVWVAECDEAIAGFCSYGPPQGDEPHKTTGELYTIYLCPRMERQGIGSRLLRHTEDNLAASGLTEAVLWVLRDNTSARRFYEARGWAPTAADKHEELWGTPIVEVQYWKRLRGRESVSCRAHKE